MRRSVLLIVDIVLMLAATLLAILLRHNLEFSVGRIIEHLPYLASTAASALIVFPAADINRTVWRFSSLPDYLRVTAAIAAAIFGAVAIAFAYNRLEGVGRSLPFLQLMAGTAFLIGARVLHKLIHLARHERKASAAFLDMTHEAPALTVLIAGVSRLTEIYIQAAAELFPGRIRIAGLLGRSDRQVGRLIAAHPILGVPEDIEAVLESLEVHGINVDRIVVASTFGELSPEVRDALLRVERSRSITLQFLAEDLGFDPDGRDATGGASKSKPPRFVPSELRFEIAPAELEMLAQRKYWIIKRAIDALAAFILLVLCTPVMLIAAALVAASLGFPVVFWQQRPGLGGRPFRLYKLRTIKSRLTRETAGAFRTRNAPRLLEAFCAGCAWMNFRSFSISCAEICPLPGRGRFCRAINRRPTAPACWFARALQDGHRSFSGRGISPEDKAALDVWYVRNASLALDIEIAIRTVPVVLFGERISVSLIERAWRDLMEIPAF